MQTYVCTVHAWSATSTSSCLNPGSTYFLALQEQSKMPCNFVKPNLNKRLCQGTAPYARSLVWFGTGWFGPHVIQGWSWVQTPFIQWPLDRRTPCPSDAKRGHVISREGRCPIFVQTPSGQTLNNKIASFTPTFPPLAPHSSR